MNLKLPVNPQEILGWITWALHLVVSLGLLLVFVGIVAKLYRYNLPLPTMGETQLAYLAGAWWLYNGGRILRS